MKSVLKMKFVTKKLDSVCVIIATEISRVINVIMDILIFPSAHVIIFILNLVKDIILLHKLFLQIVIVI